MNEIESAIIQALRSANDKTIIGVVLENQYEPDDVLDAIFELQNRNIVTGKFRPNPNRRRGSDFGWVRLVL
jgi:hypothetical protein